MALVPAHRVVAPRRRSGQRLSMAKKNSSGVSYFATRSSASSRYWQVSAMTRGGEDFPGFHGGPIRPRGALNHGTSERVKLLSGLVPICSMPCARKRSRRVVTDGSDELAGAQVVRHGIVIVGSKCPVMMSVARWKGPPERWFLPAAWDHRFAINGTIGLPLMGPPTARILDTARNVKFLFRFVRWEARPTSSE